MKLCNVCKISKSLNEFCKHRKGLYYACKSCSKISNQKYVKSEKSKQYRREYREKNKKLLAQKNKEYLLKNPIKSHDRHLKSKYKISREYYEEMFLNQNGKCAICKKDHKEFKKRLSVDHCHDTLWIRGLLCTRCNAGIGNFLDDPKILSSAITYLNFHMEVQFEP